MTRKNIAQTILSSTQAKVTAGVAAASALVMGSVGNAQAQESATAAFTALETQATDFAASAWPVVATVVGSLLAISLFKKFANKAT